MNNDPFDINLEKNVALLPDYEPGKMVWYKIEAQLEFDEKLDKEIPNLPEFEFKNESWNNIEKYLDKPTNYLQNKKLKKLIIYSLSAAAVLILLIGLSIFFNKNNDIKITYSQEEIITNEQIEEPENKEPDPVKFLDENCKKVPEVCNSPEFLEQKKQLIELNNEYKNISEVIKMYGESPELVKSLIKIENLKSEILKDLIKTLNS